MARVIYLDCFSGIAGDMFLAAAIDAGLPVDTLVSALGSLGVPHEIVTSRVTRAGISATHVNVVDRTAAAGRDHAHPHAPNAHQHGEHRSVAEITRLIDASSLSSAGKARATRLFQRLGEAEAAIHGVGIEDVHLHEVGAVDSIVDICGAVVAMEWLAADEVVVSPLNVGGGTVRIAHGVFPVPAPATVRLLQGVPVYSTGLQAELVTPTGALIVSEYATSYGPMPGMTIARAGYGAGTKDFAEVPNVVRLVIGESVATSTGVIVEIRCEIDDMNPQLYGPLMDRLFEAGAVDAFFTPVQMKKNRPGTLVTVLAPPDRRAAVSGVLFTETTTIGIRYQEMRRETLAREVVTLETPIGAIRFKVASRDGHVLNVSPEFDDCVRLAAEQGLPLKEVHALALAAWMHR